MDCCSGFLFLFLYDKADALRLKHPDDAQTKKSTHTIFFHLAGKTEILTRQFLKAPILLLSTSSKVLPNNKESRCTYFRLLYE